MNILKGSRFLCIFVGNGKCEVDYSTTKTASKNWSIAKERGLKAIKKHIERELNNDNK